MERRGLSYEKRVAEVNALYDRYVKTGLSNREIWRRYVWPRWGVSERTFYNMLYAPAKPGLVTKAVALKEGWLWPEEEIGPPQSPQLGGGSPLQPPPTGGGYDLEFFRKVDG